MAALGTNVMFALEGPNEPGGFPFTYNGVSTTTSWLAVAAWQRDWNAAIKADSILASVPVLTPTNNLCGDRQLRSAIFNGPGLASSWSAVTCRHEICRYIQSARLPDVFTWRRTI